MMCSLSYRPRMWVEAPEMMKTKGLLGKMVSRSWQSTRFGLKPNKG